MNMTILKLSIIGILLSFVGYGQEAELVVFRHDLRWVDETKFPNYFLDNNIRDSIFDITNREITKYLNLKEIKFLKNIDYKIINGFGNQKIKMPKSIPGNDYEVGIFSFITRATVGYSVFWKFNLVIKKKDKVVLKKEIIHELEYYNVSGYLTAKRWLSSQEFQDIYLRLLQESLGVLPPTNEIIIVGFSDRQEENAKINISIPERNLLKIDGDWLNANNFVARLESPIDTVMGFRFKEKLNWEFPKPKLSNIIAQLFTEVTNIEVVYDELVEYNKKCSLVFSDGEELGVFLKWIELETRSSMSDEIESINVSDPLVAELYSQKEQIGYFLYTREEIVHATDKTEDNFNIFNGFQTKNTLGIEQIYKIEGMIYDTPIYAEYNESKGIIEVKSGEEFLGSMFVENVNPDNRSISNNTLSKNKINISSSGDFRNPSLKNTNSVEWYPVYLPKGLSNELGKMCIETMIFLFFGMGNM